LSTASDEFLVHVARNAALGPVHAAPAAEIAGCAVTYAGGTRATAAVAASRTGTTCSLFGRTDAVDTPSTLAEQERSLFMRRDLQIPSQIKSIRGHTKNHRIL